MVLHSVTLAVLALLCSAVTAHPPMNFAVNSSAAVNASNAWVDMLNADLKPFQTSKIAANGILSYQRQLVSGFNHFLAVVVEEDLSVFEAASNPHHRGGGFPNFELVWLEMFQPGAWESDTSYKLRNATVVSKRQVYDVKAGHQNGHDIEHCAGIALGALNERLEALAAAPGSGVAYASVEQVLQGVLRAAVQVVPIEMWTMPEMDKVEGASVELVDVVFATTCKKCDADPDTGEPVRHVAFATTSKGVDGEWFVNRVWSGAEMQFVHWGPEQEHKHGMSDGGVAAVAFAMLCVGSTLTFLAQRAAVFLASRRARNNRGGGLMDSGDGGLDMRSFGSQSEDLQMVPRGGRGEEL